MESMIVAYFSEHHVGHSFRHQQFGVGKLLRALAGGEGSHGDGVWVIVEFTGGNETVRWQDLQAETEQGPTALPEAVHQVENT